MFMHMPKRLGIPVMVLVAACLGAYWWFVLSPVRVGEWEIYQGTAKEVFPENEEPYVDISYTVRNPAKPLFACRPGYGGEEIHVGYVTEWPTTLRIVIEEKDGTAWETHLPVVPAEGWAHDLLSGERFVRVGASAADKEKTHPNLRNLRPRVVFYDGSGVRRPSTRFSNRICFQAVEFPGE